MVRLSISSNFIVLLVALVATQFTIVDATLKQNATKLSTNETLILRVHNQARKLHGNVPPLKWSRTLASFAQNYVNKCNFSPSGGPYGENVAAGTTDWNLVISLWVGEGRRYKYKPPTGFTANTGHFTQIVWKATKEIGCAIQACANFPSKFILACEYKPHGNVLGANNSFFVENVFPPK